MSMAAQVFDAQSLKNIGKKACGGLYPLLPTFSNIMWISLQGLRLETTTFHLSPFPASSVAWFQAPEKGFLQRLTGHRSRARVPVGRLSGLVTTVGPWDP